MTLENIDIQCVKIDSNQNDAKFIVVQENCYLTYSLKKKDLDSGKKIDFKFFKQQKNRWLMLLYWLIFIFGLALAFAFVLICCFLIFYFIRCICGDKNSSNESRRSASEPKFVSNQDSSSESGTSYKNSEATSGFASSLFL